MKKEKPYSQLVWRNNKGSLKKMTKNALLSL